LTPVDAQFDVNEVTHALDLVRLHGDLPASEFRLLAYLVEEALAGRAHDLHQKKIADDVFKRDILTFDPRKDSIVRTTARNLRANLSTYYAERGLNDPLRIELTAGTYVPVFCPRAPLSAAGRRRLWKARATIEARTVSGYRAAIEHLDAILAESPSYSLALALKAEALASQAIHGVHPRPNLERARQSAERAIDHPHAVWQAWLAQGIVRQSLHWDWNGAEQAYREALRLSAGEAAMNVWYNAYLAGRGRPQQGAAHLQRAVDHFGYSNATSLGDLSMMLILARDYPAAEAAIETALEAAPGYYQHHLHHAILREATGDPQSALKILDRTPLHLMERPVTWGLRALFSGLSGSAQIARRRLTWFNTISKSGRYIPPSQLAACHIGLGNHDEAVRSLKQAAEDRDPLAVWFWAYPMTRHLHGHSGFQALIDELRLIRY
jgi:tetratricopeptide (TPR) repeat protein